MKTLAAKRRFTLTELLVVIAIMAALAMVTIPVVGPLFRDHALDASVAKVQGVFMNARSLAATNQQAYYVSFNTLTDANGRRTKDCLIIYNSWNYVTNEDVSPVDTIPSSNVDQDNSWQRYWHEPKNSTDSDLTTRTKKLLVAAPPVYLEKDTRIGLFRDACGSRSYIKVHPDGSLEFGGNFDNATGAGHSESRANAPATYIDMRDNRGVVLISVEDESTGTTPVSRSLGLVLLTGEFYSNH